MTILLKFLFLSSLQAHAATDLRAISVTGQCMRRVAPDRGSVTLVAQFTKKTSTEAAKRAQETYEKIRTAVQKLKLKDLELQTSEYAVQEQVEYQRDRKVSLGMQASMGLQITTSEISRLGEVAALGAQFEINRVEALTTFLSRERSKKEREDCLVEAIQNARDKADKMAKAADAKMGEVQVIDETPIAQPMPYAATEMMSMKAAGGDDARTIPTIESKAELINVSVLVKFALK